MSVSRGSARGVGRRARGDGVGRLCAFAFAFTAAALAGCSSPSAPEPAPEPSRAVRFADADVFVPPDFSERAAAVGPLGDLEPALRRAFSESPQFKPLSPPEPGDWLHRFRERGQTFEAYTRAGANQPDAPGEGRDTIYILPIGTFPDGFVVEEDRVVLVRSPAPSVLEDYAERFFFGLPVKVLAPVSLEGARVRTRARHGRDQLFAPDVLEHLTGTLPPDAFSMIALTNDDLYAEDAQEYSFGYASLTARVGVYSFARYDPLVSGEERGPDFLEVIVRRSLKIMAHEVGHMFGLEHCVHFSCVMNGAADLVETDRNPSFLCPLCLRKLQLAVGFEPVARYRALHEFYEDQGFEPETAWLEHQITFITGEY